MRKSLLWGAAFCGALTLGTTGCGKGKAEENQGKIEVYRITDKLPEKKPAAAVLP